MMRAWESRPDCRVVDEPFYGCYLLESGAQHPMREAIIRSQPKSREDVQAQLRLSEGYSLQYEKHMTHHMPCGVDLSWTVEAKHVFLIRSPARIIASYRQKMPTVSEEDIGIVRQRELFEEVSDILGERPPVMDSADVLANPEHMLQKLCHTVGIEWIEGVMTKWAPGSRASDGVWAPHWYASVEASTGFAAPAVEVPALDPADEALACQMQAHYEAMAAFKLI
jgi:hypothetical protein